MKTDFIELFEYNEDCNQILMTVFLDHLKNVPEKTQMLFNHILNSHQIWNSRIIGGLPCEVWQLNPWDSIMDINATNHHTTAAILEQKDLATPVTYTNSKGERYTNTVKDILYHIINHSTYHRAQIATDMRIHGMVPVITDYISYKRKRD
jgi:uncharacterized damage-inducible protein DinB